MKKLLLTPLILLAACAPALRAVQGTSSTLTATSGILTFLSTDSLPVLKVVALDGGSVNDARCAAPHQGVTVCKLGDVPPNMTATLVYTGTLIDANATWRTPEGKLRAIVLGGSK